MKEMAGCRIQDKFKESLVKLSVAGLKRMYDPEEKLFCIRAFKQEGGPGGGIVHEGLSVRYTIISLLGLHAFERQGGRSPVDIEAGLDILFRKVRSGGDLGDTGLFLWLIARIDPKLLNRYYGDLEIETLWDRYRSSALAQTMELSWVLTGLSLAAQSVRGGAEALSSVARAAFETLRRNYGGRGIFGHQGRGTLSGLLRGRVGSFADQVYPIYALSSYAEIFRDRAALKMALDCAGQVCRLQGPDGQWWWHYDMKSGRVLGRYPVYSVHQDGMAPMALQAVGSAAGVDFSMHVNRGLLWLTGRNELGRNLVETGSGLIWRSFYQKPHKKYADRIACILGLERETCPGDLNMLYECRPYHLGWLLYALA